MRRLFCCNSDPLAILESIIRSPKNAEPIGLKRLMARPVAKYTIAAQEKHEKDEKVHADD